MVASSSVPLRQFLLLPLVAILAQLAPPASAQLCPSCPCLSTTLMATDAGGTYSCGERMAWVQTNVPGMQDASKACQYVSNEFPTICTYGAQQCETTSNCGGDAVVQGGVTQQPKFCPRIQWRDEFMGTALDTSKWSYQIGDGCDLGICGWGNNELQWYQANNVKVSNSLLVIEARKEATPIGGKQYSSARIRTKGLADIQYGRLEARIKIPQGQGIWPAFWMLPTDEVYGGWPQSGEIDIMEAIGREPNKAFGTLHYGPAWPNNKYQGSALKLVNNEPFYKRFHEFAVDWSPNKIAWSVDGASFLTLTNQTISPWPFNQRFHFLLNVAVGGAWPGMPDGSTTFPQQMQVDYVRVFDKSFGQLVGPMYVDSGAKKLRFRLRAGLRDYTYQWSVPNGVTIRTKNPSTSKTILVNWGSTSGYVTVKATSQKCGVTKTFTIPVEVVRKNPSSRIKNCSCSNCQTPDLYRMAGDFSCIARMEWVAQSQALSEQEACALVSNEFPSICGAQCDPNNCSSNVQLQTQQEEEVVPSVTIWPLGQCARRIVKACGCEGLDSDNSCVKGEIARQCLGSSGVDDSDVTRKVLIRAGRICIRQNQVN